MRNTLFLLMAAVALAGCAAETPQSDRPNRSG